MGRIDRFQSSSQSKGTRIATLLVHPPGELLQREFAARGRVRHAWYRVRGERERSESTATPIQFGNIDPNYPAFFEPFSAQRLFTALGSTIMDVNFFVPGSATPSFTTAFGAVFSDVDLASTSSLQFFDLLGNSLGAFFVPAVAGN